MVSISVICHDMTIFRCRNIACVQRPGDKEPTWLEGLCVISRNPVIHPGDGNIFSCCNIQVLMFIAVQRVYAIGKPPSDKLCLFAHLKNVVVLPSVGTFSSQFNACIYSLFVSPVQDHGHWLLAWQVET